MFSAGRYLFQCTRLVLKESAMPEKVQKTKPGGSSVEKRCLRSVCYVTAVLSAHSPCFIARFSPY
jgi:hypothetical protein